MQTKFNLILFQRLQKYFLLESITSLICSVIIWLLLVLVAWVTGLMKVIVTVNTISVSHSLKAQNTGNGLNCILRQTYCFQFLVGSRVISP